MPVIHLSRLVGKVDLQDVIDGLPLAVIVLNRDRYILFANRVAVSHAGKGCGELFGMRPGEA